MVRVDIQQINIPFNQDVLILSWIKEKKTAIHAERKKNNIGSYREYRGLQNCRFGEAHY
jgi:hypothetical protein